VVEESDIEWYKRKSDGQTKIEVRMIDETVWLSQKQMAELFQPVKSNVIMHISNVLSESELAKDGVILKFRIPEFKKKPIQKKCLPNSGKYTLQPTGEPGRVR
jgi:hypothetical protein